MKNIVYKYLEHLNIPVSENYFGKRIVSHPNYPSLLSIADTLEGLGIDRQVGRIEKGHRQDLPFPSLLQLDRRGGELLLLKDRADLHAHRDDLEHWNGIVLKVQATDSITDEEHNRQWAEEKRNQRRWILFAGALLGLLLIPTAIGGGAWLHLLLLATAAGGTAVGYLLVAKDLGITYRPVESFCKAGRGTNCDRILHAEEAKLFGNFTFSDAALSYFGFQLIIAGLFAPLYKGGAAFWGVLAAAGGLTVPVIVYSLYYQAVRANTWCRLCVMVDLVLGAQLILFGVMLYRQQLVPAEMVHFLPLSVSILLFAAVALSLVLLKSRLKEAGASAQAEVSARRVKHNPEVFAGLLFREEKRDMVPFEFEMSLGNSEASLQIIMAVNLYCNPCRTAFETVDRLLNTYPDKAGILIRVLPAGQQKIEDLPASTYLINYWRQYIHGKNNEAVRTRELIGTWYEAMDVEAFARQYPMDGETDHEEMGSETLAGQHYQWIEHHEITKTPTFFINGYKMPRHYRIKDLMVMMPGLTTLFKEQQKQKLHDKQLV